MRHCGMNKTMKILENRLSSNLSFIKNLPKVKTPNTRLVPVSSTFIKIGNIGRVLENRRFRNIKAL